MAEIVFDYSVASLMNEAEKEKAARIITFDYLLMWNGKSWTVKNTVTGQVSNVYVSVV